MKGDERERCHNQLQQQQQQEIIHNDNTTTTTTAAAAPAAAAAAAIPTAPTQRLQQASDRQAGKQARKAIEQPGRLYIHTKQTSNQEGVEDGWPMRSSSSSSSRHQTSRQANTDTSEPPGRLYIQQQARKTKNSKHAKRTSHQEGVEDGLMSAAAEPASKQASRQTNTGTGEPPGRR